MRLLTACNSSGRSAEKDLANERTSRKGLDVSSRDVYAFN
jgi:hypothetical protein